MNALLSRSAMHPHDYVSRIAALGAVLVFTRILSPDQFGLYALVIVYGELLDSVALNWSRLGVQRFHHVSGIDVGDLRRKAGLVSLAGVGHGGASRRPPGLRELRDQLVALLRNVAAVLPWCRTAPSWAEYPARSGARTALCPDRMRSASPWALDGLDTGGPLGRYLRAAFGRELRDYGAFRRRTVGFDGTYRDHRSAQGFVFRFPALFGTACRGVSRVTGH